MSTLAPGAAAPTQQAAMPPGRIDGPSAWRGDELAAQPERWLFRIDEEDQLELERAVKGLQQRSVPFHEISPETFPLPRLGSHIKTLLHDQLLNGLGFVLMRGLPVDRWSHEQSATAYLGIGSYLGSFRSQNAKGHLLGHVRDLGLDIRNQTTRYYQTTRQLDYHTDSCDIVGLLCLKTSKEGGASRIVSSVTLYNEIRERRPDLLPLLFNLFPTDRRGEIPPGMDPWFEVPVFSWYEGKLNAIYSGQYIRSAQVNHPEACRLSAAEHEAIDLLDQLADDPALRLQMAFKPGDMQFLHNHQVLHSRTDFIDWPEPERKRHLLRLWVAPGAGRPLPPSYASRYGSLTPGDRGGIITKETKLKFVLEPE